MIRKFWEIAEECYHLKNFVAFYQIWAGLMDPSVWRLKQTWEVRCLISFKRPFDPPILTTL